jgi:hypothetical protein
MNFIKTLGTGTIKYFKGLLAIGMLWLLPALGIFIFDSCKKVNYENSESGEAARKFNEVMDKVRSSINPMVLDNSTSMLHNSITEAPTNTNSTMTADLYYLDFPNGTNPQVITDFSSSPTVQNLYTALSMNGVSIDNTLTSSVDLTIQVEQEAIRNALQPLVVEAKNYLYSKGVSEQQIVEMLKEEGSEEIDLIPFVKTLTAVEEGQYAVNDIELPLINQVHALPHYLECAIEALGFDAIYALGHSGASSWSWSTMKSVFKGVAKRFLGPIGVAIAVVSFTTCML